jgi:predicted O-methyltransferase YrrM
MEIKRNHILDYKGADFKSFDMIQSIEFASAEGGKIERGMAPNELEIIYKGLELLGQMPLTIVETGMGHGFSTRMFLLHILKYGGELHSIEIFPREEFLGYLTELGLRDYVILHQEDARKFNNWTEPIDFLSIDSEHAISNVLGEFFRFRLFLKHHRALIGFHDTVLPPVEKGIAIINDVDNLEPVMVNLAAGGFGYSLYRYHYPEKLEFPDYSHCALTEEQKSKLVLTYLHS